jgi:hypothetical protein
MTTGSFLAKANTAYLVFAFVESNTADTVTFSSNAPSLTFNLIGAGSANYNNNDYEYGRYLTGDGNNHTITVTTVKTISKPSYLKVIELGGCPDTSNPIAQSAYTTSPGTSATSPYTAFLPAALASTDFDVYWLTGGDDIGATITSSPAITLLDNTHGGGTTGATFWASTPSSQTTEQFCKGATCPGGTAHWGTIAVEVKRP